MRGITIKDIKKYMDNTACLKTTCKCGHIITMPVYLKKIICSYCGRTVMNNSKAYFLKNLKKEMDRNRTEDSNGEEEKKN